MMDETADEKRLRQYQMMVDAGLEPIKYWQELLKRQEEKMKHKDGE